MIGAIEDRPRWERFFRPGSSVKVLVIRCGTPDCDWGNKVSELSDEQLEAVLFGISEAPHADARPSGVGNTNITYEFGP